MDPRFSVRPGQGDLSGRSVMTAPFPESVHDFQRLFPDDTACAQYLEALRWPHGFVCRLCGSSDAYHLCNGSRLLRISAGVASKEIRND
jgi:hypothetical protein